MPTITSLSPTSGPTTGGTSVTITGTGFTGPTTVRCGATATTFTLDSPTRITAIAPGGSTGTAAVTVTTARGTSNLRHADHRGGPAGSAGTVQVTVMGSGRSSNGLGYTYM
ncbi:IPT/TIG domain-containing protein [Nocardia rhamnosiphila]|uniref:IPT/TIG domain-containing protein n=1 Tax=Nocardia rhamnosiphila TaxID=426716 RepID=UPI0033F3BE7B